MQTKIAYFGDSWCRPSRRRPVKTFVDIVSQYWGQDLTTVAVGQQGGVTPQDLLRQSQHTWITTGWDLAIVIHEPFKGDDASARAVYLAQQQRLVDWYMEQPRGHVVHWLDRESAACDRLPENRDYRWLEYMKFNDDYRYAVSYEVSDNAMDQVGNWLVAEHIIELVEQCRNSKK